MKSTADAALLVCGEPGAYTARAALCSSLKRSSDDRQVQQQQAKMQEAVGLNSSFPGKEKNVMPVSAIIMRGRETFRVDSDGHAQGGLEKESFLLGHEENRKQSTLLRGFHEKKELKSPLDPSLSRIQSEGTSKQHVVIREPIVRKSILLTSQSKELKVKVKPMLACFHKSIEGWGEGVRRTLLALLPLYKLEVGVRTVLSFSRADSLLCFP